ncbi:hypothetical protein [Tessaracoccus palaemonis]|uniref:MFS transporter n=1 Tax=Tessaracoccus palaemonis TaxID=2829499 RepID=A0ABX8SDY6_9ACTN|nr:hypothetical protein [Tessaracoccus palaemonis]QXT61628.1 hypothetical protein KDB89_07325 [Tessaracoccus palaemonis]
MNEKETAPAATRWSKYPRDPPAQPATKTSRQPVVGSVFASNLAGLLAERMPAEAAASVGDTSSFTPELVHSLPDAVQSIIVGAYNDALTPVYLWLAPLAAVAVVVLVFIRPKPLATSIDRAVKDARKLKEAA